MELRISNGGIKENKDLQFNQKDDYLNNLVDSLPVAVYVYNLQIEKVVYLSKEIYNLLGYKDCQFDIIARDFFSKVHPADIEIVKSRNEQLKFSKEGKDVELEYRLKVASGEWKWIRSKIRVLKRATDGKALEILGFIEDINESKKSNSDIKNKNNLLQGILNSSLNGIVGLKSIRNESGKIVDFKWIILNEKAKQILGEKEIQVVGEKISEESPNLKKIFLLEEQIKVIETGKPFHQEIFFDFNGSTYWLEIGSVKYNDGVVITFNDITQRKETEQKLKEKNNFIQKIIDINPCIVTVYNPNTGKYNFVNKAVKEMLGYDPDFFISGGVPQVSSLIHPDDLLRIHQENRLAIENCNSQYLSFNDATVHNFEYRVKSKNGDYKWLQTQGIIFSRDKEGVMDQILNISIDITERKQAEEKLRESQYFIQRVAASIPDFVQVYDLIEEKVVYTNKKAFSFLGYSENEFMAVGSVSLKEIVHLDDLPNVLKSNEKFKKAEDGEILETDYRIKNKNGEWRWIQCRSTIFKRTPTGEAWQYVGIVRDITNEKIREESLKKSESLLFDSQRLAHVASYEWDIKNDKIYWTPEHYRMFGYPEGEEINFEKLEKRFHPEDVSTVKEKIERALQNIEPYNVEFRVVLPNGEVRTVWTKGKVFFDNQNNPIRLLGTVVDISERKAAEEKIRKAKEDLKKLNSDLEYKVQERTKELNEAQKISKIGNWIYNIENQKITWSEELFRIYDIDPSLGAPDFETLLTFFPHSEKFVDKIEKAINERVPIHYDTPLMLSNGERKNIQIIAKPELDKEGKVVRLFGTTLDITERKTFEEKILESQQQLSLVTDAIPALISYINTDLKYTFVNEGYVKWFGLKKSEIIGKSVKELLGEEFFQKIAPSLKNVFEGEATGLEIIFPNPRGEVHFFTVKYIPDFDESKRVRGCIILAINNTESISVQKALRESEERYRFMAESIPSIVWTANAVGEIDFFNSRWMEFTGLSFEDTIRFGWKNCLHPKDMDNTFDVYLSAIKKGTEFKIEHLLRRQDGEYRWMLTRAVPLKNSEGIIVRWFGTALEIHDEKKYIENLAKTKEQLSLINLELSKKNEELQIINSDLDNFIYTASHDLKAPISNLEGLFGTLLEDVKLDDGLQEIHKMINHSFQRFRNTIKDLTEISKVQKNQHEDIGTEQFSKLLEETRYELHDQIVRTNAVIEENFPVDEIKFSRKNLRSVIYNFVSNGIKYSSPDRTPKIKVSTSYVDDKYILLTIEDNGLGIPEHHKKKVFGMFKRLHDHVEGTGIGLYIVKRIIDNAGGKIELESEEGKGSTFRVYFSIA